MKALTGNRLTAGEVAAATSHQTMKSSPPAQMLPVMRCEMDRPLVICSMS